MKKIVLCILAVLVLLGIAVACEHNVYFDYYNVWSVGPKEQGHVFNTANEAISYIIKRDKETTKGTGVSEDRTLYLLRPVLSSDSDALVIWGKSYILDEKYRGMITVPEEYEGTLCIDFNGFRYDFANNIDYFFTIKGGSEVYIYNGETVIFKESQSPITNAALIVGTRTVTIDEHLIDDRRVGPEEEAPAAVYVTEEGSLVITCETEERAETGVAGTFTIDDGGTVLIEEGTVTIAELEQGDEGGLAITGGEIHSPHEIDEKIEAAIVPGYEDNVDKRIIHEPLQYYPAKQATCLEAGNIEYWQCLTPGCMKYFSDEECTKEITLEDTIVAKLDHNLLHREKVESTCTEQGYAEHWICQNCGHYFLDSEAKEETTWEALQLPLADHQYVSVWSNNLTHHWHECSVCHAPDPESYHEHVWDEGTIIKEASSHDDGIKRYTCDVCNRTWDTAIPAHDHKYGDIYTVAPTCTEYGYKWHQCTYESCKQVTIIPDSYVDPIGHEGHKSEHERHDATCTEKGNIHYWHCDLCGAYATDEYFTNIITEKETVIAPLGHDPAPNWTHDGTKHWHLCLRTGCGVHLTEGYHNEDRICQDGDSGHHWECTVCGYATPVEAHTYGADNICETCGWKRAEDPQGGGGFDVDILVIEPMGHLECDYEKAEYTAKECVMTFKNDNADFPAKKFKWYLNNMIQEETGTTFSFIPGGRYTHTVMCVFSNDYGVGSATKVISGK